TIKCPNPKIGPGAHPSNHQLIRGKTNNLHLYAGCQIACGKYETLLYKYVLNYRLLHQAEYDVFRYLPLLHPDLVNKNANVYFLRLTCDFLQSFHLNEIRDSLIVHITHQFESPYARLDQITASYSLRSTSLFRYWRSNNVFFNQLIDCILYDCFFFKNFNLNNLF